MPLELPAQIVEVRPSEQLANEFDDADEFAQNQNRDGAVVIIEDDWKALKTKLSKPNTLPQNKDYNGTLGGNEFQIEYKYSNSKRETRITKMWSAPTFIFTIDQNAKIRMYEATLFDWPKMTGAVCAWTTDPNVVPNKIKKLLRKRSARTYLQALPSVSPLLGGFGRKPDSTSQLPKEPAS